MQSTQAPRTLPAGRGRVNASVLLVAVIAALIPAGIIAGVISLL